jgi:RimJ/RimL family protein N-acetyltransferase
MRLLLGQDEAVAAWVAARIPHMGPGADFGPCAALGVVAEDGRLLGGVVFSNWQPRWGSIEASFAADGRRWLTPRLIRQILSYPFTQLDCGRVTAVTPLSASDARRFLETFGFKREGLVRRGFGDDDAVVSGLLKTEWLRSRWNQHGQKRPDTAAPSEPGRGGRRAGAGEPADGGAGGEPE